MKSAKKSLLVVAGVIAVNFGALPLSCAQAQAPTNESRTTSNLQSSSRLQPLNVKTGLWESTRTIKRQGEMPVPAEMLNRLTPEQRARIEERMNAKSAHENTTTEKHCLTKDDLDRDRLKIAETKECTTTVINSTSTSVKAKLVCDNQGMHATGTLELVAADPEHISGSYQSAVDAGGHTMNVDGSWSAKWLGSSCGDVK